MKFGGLKAIHDTGAPAGVKDYKTLVLVHGLAMSSGMFARLLPFAQENDCRIVLVNRRGFPGAEPHTAEEYQLLKDAQEDTPKGQEALSTFFKNEAHGIYQFLEDFIAQEDIPIKGGIIFTGWAICGVWIAALLAFASSFPVNNVDVARYIRRIVTSDSNYFAFGYPVPPGSYSPMTDPEIPPEERVAKASVWATAYYTHPSDDSFEWRTPVEDPAPTIFSMTPADLEEFGALDPNGPGGTDFLVHSALQLQRKTATAQRLKALFPSTTEDGWGKIEWRYLWNERTVWETPYGGSMMRKEVAEAKATGKKMRKVVVVCWRGANHFPHWHYPEPTLKAFLADGSEEVQIC